MENFNYDTTCQIVHIQINTILDFCSTILKNEYCTKEQVYKIQEMFKILNQK